ncbi:hypothetical protein [Pantoea sp.]|uniref:hypothetical protein n=1 Tax=Pantoea sp. TaxID=69393 RepID=UPI0028AD6F75|nr:hypothetical protein [Pantoea sp.]
MPDNNAIVPMTGRGVIQPLSQSRPLPVSRVAGVINYIAPTTAVISSSVPQRERISFNRACHAAVVRQEARTTRPSISQKHALVRDNILASADAEPLTASFILAAKSRGNRRVAGKVKSIRINAQHDQDRLSRQKWTAELTQSQQKLSCINICDENEVLSQPRSTDALQMRYMNSGAGTSQQQPPPVADIPPASVATAKFPYRGEGDPCEIYAQQQQRMVILTRGAGVYAQLPNLRPALELVNKVVGEVFRKIKNPEHVGEVMDAIAFCTGIRPERVTFTIYRDFLGQVQSLLRQAGTYLSKALNENQFAVVEPPPGNIMAAATIPQDPHHRIWFSRNQSSAGLAEFFKNVIHELCHMFTTVNPAFDFIYLIPQGCNEQEICDVDELQKALLNEVAYIGSNVYVREAYFKKTMTMLGNSYPDAPLYHLFNATTSAEAAHSVEYNDWLRYVLVSRTSDLLSMLVIKLGYEKFLKNLPPQARSTADPVLDMAKIEAIKDRTSINLHLNTICHVMREITTDFRTANGIMKKLASIALPYPAETAQWLKLMGGELPNMMARLYHNEPKNSAHVLGTINCILTWLMERGNLPASYVKQCILPIPYTYAFYDTKNSKEIWQDKLINCWADLLRSFLRRSSHIPQQRDIENLVRILIQKSMGYRNIPGTVQFYKMLALELERRMNWFNHVTKNKQPQSDEPKSKKVKTSPEQPDSRLINLAKKQRWYVAIEDENGEFLRGFNPTGERITVRELFTEQFRKPGVPGTTKIICTLREWQENGQAYYHGTTRDGEDIRCENDENNLSRAAMAAYRGEKPTEEEVIMLGRDLAAGEDNL